MAHSEKRPARDYVYSHQVARSDDAFTTLQKAVETYAKFVAHGLRGVFDATAGESPASALTLEAPHRRRLRKG